MTPGTIVAERYRLDRLLGEGGMGAVWAATHVLTRKTVAIKFLKAELAGNASLVERFLREARAACAVKHPHVVQIHDVLQLPGGAPLMVMDLLDGESLGQRLLRETKIPVPDFSRIMLQTISAMVAAHAAHVVHRDLKPDNLFLSRTEDGATDLRVLDFGIAKVLSNDEESGVLTKTGSMLGTPFYMAPEQLFGEKDVDARADIWSLGIIVYECLSGRRPTEADNLGQIIKVVTTTGIAPLENAAPHVPADICAVVRRMLTSDRAARMSDLGEARVVFERYAGVSLSAPPSAIMQAVAEPIRQSGHTKALGQTPVTSPVTAPPPTGPLDWAATQPEQSATARSRWKVVAAVGVVAVLGAAGVAAPRLRASAEMPSGSPRAQAGAPAVDAAPEAFVPDASPKVEHSAEAMTASADAGAPVTPASRSPIASSSARGETAATPPRSLRSAGSSSPASAPPAASQGLLVDKPPF